MHRRYSYDAPIPTHVSQITPRRHYFTTGVPASYHRIKHGDTLAVGARSFQVLTGGGHSLEQAMLYRPEERLFLAAAILSALLLAACGAGAAAAGVVCCVAAGVCGC